MFSHSPTSYIQMLPGFVSTSAVLKQEDLSLHCSSFGWSQSYTEKEADSTAQECKNISWDFLGLGSWQRWSDRDFNGKKYGTKIWHLGGTGKEETELRWLSVRCRKRVCEETMDPSLWQLDGKTTWGVYNFGYADKEKEEIKILKSAAG